MKIACIISMMLAAATTARAEIISGQAVSWTDFSYISSITISNSFIFFATPEGILRYQRYERRWLDPITASDGLNGHEIRRLAVYPDEAELVVETEQGIYSYHSNLQQWFLETDFPDEYSRDSRPSPPLPVFFVPFGYSFSPDGIITDPQLRNWSITAFIDDNGGNFYMGTWGMGPLRADDLSYQAEFIPCGLLQKQADALYLDGDSLWIGGNGGRLEPAYGPGRLGVTLFERSRQRFTFLESRYIPGFDSDIIYDIAGDAKNIYFAGQFGLTILSRKDNHCLTKGKNAGLPDREATALAIGRDSVWIGTANGLALYTPSVDTMVIVANDMLGNRFVTGLKLTAGKLIIGTDKGAFYIDLVSREVGRMKDPDGVLGGSIRHLAVYDKYLYVASDWGATEVDMTTGKATAVPYINDAGGAYAIAANAQYIAASVLDGLMLLNRKTGKMRRFTEADGLLSVNINVMLPEGDYLWLGSEEGLTRFRWVNPDRVD